MRSARIRGAGFVPTNNIPPQCRKAVKPMKKSEFGLAVKRAVTLNYPGFDTPLPLQGRRGARPFQFSPSENPLKEGGSHALRHYLEVPGRGLRAMRRCLPGELHPSGRLQGPALHDHQSGGMHGVHQLLFRLPPSEPLSKARTKTPSTLRSTPNWHPASRTTPLFLLVLRMILPNARM